jgi:glyoxylase-like metal-dependent hydrolase (beta-lactamase superfamily II)
MAAAKISTTSLLLPWSLIAVIGIAILMAAFAPYVYGEFDAVRGHGAIVGPKPAAPVAGRWVDDYFVVEPVDPTTFAIGEPRYYQGNYSYLIIGSARAVLFDAGTGTRDITPVVRSLTTLPVTVIPSHLHYDHVGALGRFDSTALIDDPTLRARTMNSPLTLGRYEFLGLYDHLQSPTFRVDEWWAPGSTVDLGDRRLQVLSTPGHTPTSVALYDAARRQLFLGDFMYPGELYAFLPGASRGAYLTTTKRLLATLGPDTRLYTAHMQDAPAPVRAPVLEMADLKALEVTLEAIQEGKLASRGFYPRIFPVRGPITFATGWSWNNQ